MSKRIKHFENIYKLTISSSFARDTMNTEQHIAQQSSQVIASATQTQQPILSDTSISLEQNVLTADNTAHTAQIGEVHLKKQGAFRGIKTTNHPYEIVVNKVPTIVPAYIINESLADRSRPIWTTVNEHYFAELLSQARTFDGRSYTGQGVVDFTKHGVPYIRVIRTVDSRVDTITYK
jgi:hypothetical protein